MNIGQEVFNNCVCGHTHDEHQTKSGSCQYNDGTDTGCLCAGFEEE